MDLLAMPFRDTVDRDVKPGISEPGHTRLTGDFDLTWIGRRTGRAERRQVVFLAIGFAPLAVADPEEIVETLARRRSLVQQIVSRYCGSIARVDPDLQIASWGWPVACEADTRLAVAAGLEIAGELSGEARCGIDAGIAITPETDEHASGVGVVGEMHATANVLQLGAEYGTVWISETVRQLIGPAFDIDLTSGAGRKPNCWRVLRRRSAAATRLGEEPHELVGRSREVSSLTEWWRAAARGVGRAVCLEGDSGVGKSALVTRLERFARESGARVVSVHCLHETRPVALDPVRRLAEALSAPALEAAADAAQATVALRNAIERATAGRPLLLVVEDLQWCDRASLSVIEALCERISANEGVLLLSTRRPGREGSAERSPHTFGQLLKVLHLTAGEIERVLVRTPTGALLAPDMRRRIAEHADGIPLYALELARLCAEAPDSEMHHRLLSKPNALNAALTSRLDALSALKPLAQAAAVLGRRFDCRVLAVMLQMDAKALAERLGMLVSLGILERAEPGSPTAYSFTQALMWSQAYGSVLKGRRRQLHAQAAAILSSAFVDEARLQPETVAHHYRKAADHKSSFKWWRMAAEDAAANGTPATAVAHLTQALAAKGEAPDACDSVEEAELLSLLGAHLGALRGSDSRDTVAAYERALELIDTMPARPADLSFDIGWGLVAIQLVRGNVREAVIMSGRLLEDARESQRDDVLLLALRMHGTAQMLSGQVREAVELLSHAAEIYEPTLHGGLRVRYVSDPGAVALAHLASAEALAGDADASRRTRARALRLAGDIAHPHTSANVLGVLSLAAIHLDEPGTAASLARASHAIASEHGHAYWVARADLVMAWERGRRDPTHGLGPMSEALAHYHRTGAGRASVLAHCLAADVAGRAGHANMALELLDAVADAGDLHGEWIYAPEAIRLKALALGQLGPTYGPEAERLLDEAEALARRTGAIGLVARAAAARAELGSSRPGKQKRGLRSRNDTPADAVCRGGQLDR